MKILVLNGPSLNMLGIREPELYGNETYKELCERITDYADKKGIEVSIYQSNHEGDLLDKICDAYADFDGIIINAAAYTHTSVALCDALKAVSIPAVEVHITNPDLREDFRKVNFIRPQCVATVLGHGTNGYLEAIDILAEKRYDS